MNSPSCSWWNDSYGAQQMYRRLHLNLENPDAPDIGCLTAFHSKLSTFRKEGRYSDVTVIVEGQSFKCHRLVLASVFQIFDEQIFCGRATGADKIQKIDLKRHEPGIHASEFSAILDFAYTGKLPELTGWNVCTYLSTSERLKSPEVEALCTDFIRRKLHTFDSECIVEILKYAYARNKSLMKDICEVIISGVLDANCDNKNDFVSFCDALNRMSFEVLNVLMRVYRAYAYPDNSLLLQFRDEKIMHIMLKWAASRGEIDRYWKRIFEMVDCGRVSQEFLNWSSIIYGINRAGDASLSAARPDSNDRFCPFTTAARPQGYRFLPTKMYAFVKYSERLLGTSRSMNVFEFYEYGPEWMELSAAMESPWFIFRTMYVPDNFNYSLYCYGLRSNGRNFLRYDSIHQFGENSYTYQLNLPPCKSTHFDMCGLGRRMDSSEIFWYNCDAHEYCHYDGVSRTVVRKFKGDKAAIRRGIYRYHCPSDKWHSVPEPKMKVAGASITADDKLVYLIGGETTDNVIPNGLVQAYDQRCSKWLQLSNSKNSYCGAVCSCSMNGNIYVSDGRLIERYDAIAEKWEEIKISCDIIDDSKESPTLKRRKMNYEHYPKLKMVPFRNGLWVYNVGTIQNNTDVQHTIIDPYNLTVDKWNISNLINKAIVFWLDDFDDDFISEKRISSNWEEQKKRYRIMDVVAHL